MGRDSFDLFYERQRRPLINLAFAMSGSRYGAEDLAQEALVAAYRSWDEICKKDNPGTVVLSCSQGRRLERWGLFPQHCVESAVGDGCSDQTHHHQIGGMTDHRPVDVTKCEPT